MRSAVQRRSGPRPTWVRLDAAAPVRPLSPIRLPRRKESRNEAVGWRQRRNNSAAAAAATSRATHQAGPPTPLPRHHTPSQPQFPRLIAVRSLIPRAGMPPCKL